MRDQLHISQNLKKQIFDIDSSATFQSLALEIFQYQAEYNFIYKEFISLLGVNKEDVLSINQIPFLPIEFFKQFKITSASGEPEIIFKSSGTTGSSQSSHYIYDTGLYKRSIINCFKLFYGDPEDYLFLALLPSYLEQGNSSLVYMMNHLIKLSNQNESGFYLSNFEELIKTIKECNRKKKIFLMGVSYALLHLAENYQINLSDSIVMETGGMKGKRNEIIRNELHNKLKDSFQVENIHSEYSMTELMSQAYSNSYGLFFTPPWMKIFIRDIDDPFSNSTSGAINIIDLANIDTCSFIATQDLGKINSDNSFEVLGRVDNSDIRGCNLLF